jgi:hypothetical protein
VEIHEVLLQTGAAETHCGNNAVTVCAAYDSISELKIAKITIK